MADDTERDITEDDDDPDINFEVRPEKLSCKSDDENSVTSRSSSKNKSDNKSKNVNASSSAIDTSHLGINQKIF